MTSHPSPVTRHLKLALIGAKGMLAQAILRTVPDCYEVHCYDLPEFNMTDREQVLSTLDSLRPDIVINCAAFTNVDGCETQEDLAVQVNGTAVGFLAEAVRRIDATLVHISTDYVFDGNKREPYLEEDKVAPQSAYGRSKLAGEQALLGSGLEKYFIVRTSWLYGPGGNNFVETMIRLAAEREELRVVADQIGSPTYTDDLAEAIFNLLKLTGHPSPVTRHGHSAHPSPPPTVFIIFRTAVSAAGISLQKRSSLWRASSICRSRPRWFSRLLRKSIHSRPKGPPIRFFPKKSIKMLPEQQFPSGGIV